MWADILQSLQSEPDCTATSLLDQLIKKYPEQHDASQLRTLQRRVGEWRATMARTLVLPGATEHLEASPISPPTGATLGEFPLRLATLTSATTPQELKRESTP